MSLVLPEEAWPEADRALWASLMSAGGPLDDRGRLAHLRETSRETLAKRYGRWLRWVGDREPGALDLAPVDRPTRERLRRWLDDLDHVAPMSRLMFIDGVFRIATAAAPARDWTTQKRLISALKRAAGRGSPGRKDGRILSSRVLFDTGRRITEAAATLPAHMPSRATGLRDGAMIALLALMPMRRRTLAALRLGESVLVGPDRITIAVPETLSKTGVPWDADVPDLCLPILSKYLDEGRPVFAARGPGNDPHLWLDRNGKGLSWDYIGPRIAEVTKRELGVRIPPHFFRDAAATTLARTSAHSAKLIRPVLGHSSDRTGTRHYNHAKTIEAGRDYSALLARLKDAQ